MTSLTEKVAQLDRRVNELVAASDDLKARVAVLEVDGVGRVTAASLVHLVPELGTGPSRPGAPAGGLLGPSPTRSATRR